MSIFEIVNDLSWLAADTIHTKAIGFVWKDSILHTAETECNDAQIKLE